TFVTRTVEPMGNVRCAAVMAFWSKMVPSAPARLWYGGPYQLAIPNSVRTGLPDISSKPAVVCGVPAGGFAGVGPRVRVVAIGARIPVEAEAGRRLSADDCNP